MLEEFLKSAARHMTETNSPRRLAQKVAEDTGMETEVVQGLFEDPEKAEAFLGRRYLKLSALLADNLEDAISSGELTSGDTIRAIPVVSKTARLFLGKSTETFSLGDALLRALEEDENEDTEE